MTSKEGNKPAAKGKPTSTKPVATTSAKPVATTSAKPVATTSAKPVATTSAKPVATKATDTKSVSKPVETIAVTKTVDKNPSVSAKPGTTIVIPLKTDESTAEKAEAKAKAEAFHIEVAKEAEKSPPARLKQREVNYSKCLSLFIIF